MHVYKELKVIDLRESSCLGQGDTGYIFFLVCSEVWPVSETASQCHQGRRPSRINGRCRRDTMMKKVPDKVYRGGSGGGRQSSRKDIWGGHTQSQKMLIKRWAGMKSRSEVPWRWQWGHAHTLEAQPIFLRRSAPGVEVGRTHFSHALVCRFC